ncbi:MAG: leucine-rich repeat protein [Clostridiales bacterium]|nr:leucine-rich repeat protein [Clostridiales bacterium]
MKRKITLIILSVIAAVCLAFGLAACALGGGGNGGQEHSHTFDETRWEHNDNTHWHPATCEHTNERGSEAKHSLDADGACTVCPYVSSSGGHQHTFDTTRWDYNETYHWNPATCGHSSAHGNEAKHNFNGGTTCMCGYSKSVEPGEHYAVQFDVNGGNPVIEYATYEKGTKIDAPDQPSRIGYSFGGWYTDVNCTQPVTFPYEVSKNVTFYAKWTSSAKVTVNFAICMLRNDTRDFDYSQHILDSIQIDRGAKLEQPANPRDITYTDEDSKVHTYKFAYWNFDASYQSNTSYAVLFPVLKTDYDEITLYARYVEVSESATYAKLTVHPGNGEKDTVMYGVQGRSLAIANLDSLDYSPFYSDRSAPRRPGYTATGYYKSQDFNASNVYPIPFKLENAENDVYIRWQETKELTVTYDLNYDNLTIPASFPYNGYITRIDDPIRAGYTFDGWYYPFQLADEDNRWNFDYDYARGNITLTAKWVKTATVITFDMHGGKARNPVAVSKGWEITSLPQPSRQSGNSSWNFLGWYLDSSYSQSSKIEPTTDNGYAVNNDITLHAKWSDEIDLRQFKFSFIGGFYAVSAANTDISGKITVPAKYLGVKVTRVEASGFRACTYITEVILPETLTHVFSYAFYGCTALKKLVLPENLVQLAYNSLDNCVNLEEINFPSGGKFYNVCSSVFRYTPKVWKYLTWDKVTETTSVCYWGTVCLGFGYYVPKSTDFNDGLTEAKNYNVASVTSYTVKAGTTMIASYAFRNFSKLETLTLADSVKYMTEYALPNEDSSNGIELKTLNLSASLESGSLTPIYPSTIETLTIPSSNVTYEVKDGCLVDKISKVLVASEKGASKIPEGVVTIGESSFRNKDLQTVTIPNTVTTIRELAFEGGAYTSIIIPDSVGILDVTAFKNCKNMESVSLGARVPLQEKSFFTNMYYLSTAKIATVAVSADNLAMYGADSVVYNRETGDIIYAAPKYNGAVTLWDKTQTLPKSIFVSTYTSFTIPESIEIEEGALGNASMGKLIILGNREEISAAYLFGSLWFGRFYPEQVAVGEIEIDPANEHMTIINGVLYNKAVTKMLLAPSGLTSLVIPDTVTDIDDGVTLYALEELTIGAGISRELIEYMLYGDEWDGLEVAGLITHAVKVSSDNSELAVFHGVLYTKDLTELIYIPAGFTGDLIIPKQVTEFNWFALGMTSLYSSPDEDYNKTVIERLTVEEGSKLTSIGSGAFVSPSNISGSYNFDSKAQDYYYDRLRQYEYTTFVIKSVDLSNATMLNELRSLVFYYQKEITDITLPDSIVSYGANVFAFCTELKTLTGGNLANARLDVALFYSNDKLFNKDGFIIIDGALLSYDQTKYPANSEFVVPGYASTIQTGVFVGVSFRTVTIPATVQYVRKDAISVSNFGTMTLILIEKSEQEANFDEGWLSKTAENIRVIYSYKTAESGEHFVTDSYGLYYLLRDDTHTAKLLNDATANGNWSGNITLPGTVSYNNTDYTLIEIGNNALSQIVDGKRMSAGVTALTLPSTVLSIGNNSLGGLGVTEFIIPDSVQTFGSNVFSGATKLEKVTIGRGVTAIPEYAFGYIGTLKTVIINGAVTSIGERAFQSCPLLAEITLPQSLESIGSNAFYNCKALISVELPANVTVLEQSAFYGCTALESVKLNNGLTTIGSNAFSGCTALKSIEIPDSVSSLGSSAFSGCSALESVKLSADITVIDANAFQNCSALKSVVVPDGVTSIGNRAFYSCKSLEYIVLPTSLKEVGKEAFYFNSKLLYVYYCGATAAEWGTIKMGTSNTPLTGATRYYYSEQEPPVKDNGLDYNGHFWRYVGGVITPWVYSG